MKELPVSKKELIVNPPSDVWRTLVGKIQSHSFRAEDVCKFQTIKGESTNKFTRFYGIELEVERRNTTPEDIVARLYNAMPGNVIVKHDGSVANGFEIVSSPATLEAHRVMWQPFFLSSEGKAPAKYLKSFDTNTCGMHIHISRASIRPILLYSFWRFMNQWDHDEYIARIAGRSQNGYSTPVKTQSFFETVSRPQSRYHFVNLSNSHTIEIRIFKGNTDYIGFFKNLDFIDSLLVLLETNPKSNGEDYIKFIFENADKWPYMFTWLKKHKVELSEVIPKEKPKAIIKPLLTFKFPGEE